MLQHPNIQIKERFLSMDAYGFASPNGEPQRHYFEINLFEEIDVDVSTTNIVLKDNKLNFMLTKSNSDIWWSRLTAQPQKQNWIHIDEELWIPYKIDGTTNNNSEFRDIRRDYPGIDKFVETEELGYRKSDPKTTYLILYNLFQFIGYLYILIVIYIECQRDGYEKSFKMVYQTTGNAMKFCQLLQYLEVMHPMFGYTKGSPLFPFLQVTGRNFVLFMIIDAEQRIQTKPVILYLFICWSLIECIRYPYYILSLLKHKNGFLTWLRYTIWIPLYPIGAFCEGVVLLRNIPYFEETKQYSVAMPNKWNFTFCMPTFIKVYLIFGLIPGIFFMMKYMAKMRQKKLNVNRINYISNDGKKKRYTI